MIKKMITKAIAMAIAGKEFLNERTEFLVEHEYAQDKKIKEGIVRYFKCKNMYLRFPFLANGVIREFYIEKLI